MVENAVWKLICEKLTKRASNEELAELQHLLTNTPEISESLEYLSHWWVHREDENEEDIEKAYARHLLRMKNS